MNVSVKKILLNIFLLSFSEIVSAGPDFSAMPNLDNPDIVVDGNISEWSTLDKRKIHTVSLEDEGISILQYKHDILYDIAFSDSHGKQSVSSYLVKIPRDSEVKSLEISQKYIDNNKDFFTFTLPKEYPEEFSCFARWVDKDVPGSTLARTCENLPETYSNSLNRLRIERDSSYSSSEQNNRKIYGHSGTFSGSLYLKSSEKTYQNEYAYLNLNPNIDGFNKEGLNLIYHPIGVGKLKNTEAYVLASSSSDNDYDYLEITIADGIQGDKAKEKYTERVYVSLSYQKGYQAIPVIIEDA